jgi:SWI/SNF-related matrix-associated actin-dependent regulator 1 of chromatin subfamily A
MTWQLFPFQLLGARFLAQRSAAFLCDEPGLGKSAQAIRAADLIGAARILVICPASIRINWLREFRRFALFPRPEIICDIDDGSVVEDEQVVVCGWPNLHHHLARLMARPWDAVIVDEAHNAKSHEAQRTVALYGPKCDSVGGLVEVAEHVWLLTGTPLPNHPGEIWPHLYALFRDALRIPGRGQALMTYPLFRARYCVTAEKVFGGKRVSVVLNGKNLTDLSNRVRPLMLRRKTDEVLELPPLRFAPVVLDPGDALASIRLAEQDGAFAELRRALAEIDADDAGADLADDDTQRLNDAMVLAGPHLAQLRRALGLAKVGPVVEYARDLFQGGVDKLVIFAWHSDVVEDIARRLNLAGHRTVVLNGSTPLHQRQEAVDSFQNDPKVVGFVGNHQAAGEGWTLTAAARALFAECTFTPKDLDQAARRIRRIGQTRACLAEIAGLAGTLDEAYARVLARKGRTIRTILKEESHDDRHSSDHRA